ncbi:PA2169 family four-helix-bundle protein [Telmatospirillum sp. J64-1]|uniref:PA2169 family four-helix-bundle protein n=1 Tax=Telmatospirillum sp. J64-1 TaxID=2502183 RepID=UPI00115E1817|nr:PA2169 family four-helix-bundle protein [Telmatospirillum sp. J64-1]
MLRDDLELTLDQLISLCNDAWEDYEEAAAATEDAEMSALFTELAMQRREMAEVLKRQVRRMGERPRDRDTNLGAAERLLTRIRAAFARDPRLALLEECERADGRIAAKMAHALNTVDLRAEDRDILTRYHGDVTASVGRLAALRTRLFP